jgi:ArsR family transcriptional regulator
LTPDAVFIYITISGYIDIVMETVNLFKALSDESRLRILFLLRNNELSVNEIVALLGMGQSRISRHLKILADAGLLSYRKEGLWVFYMMGNDGLWGEINRPVLDKLASGTVFKNDSVNLRNYLSERTERGREYFNTVAPEWSRIRSSMLGDLDLNSEVCSLVPPGTVIADLGCGSGELAEKLLVKADKVIGVDRSPAMLSEARRLLAGKIGMIDLRLGELDHLPVRDSEADSVVISMVLHYLDEQQQAIDEASRILKSGGVLILAELESHNNEKMRSVYGHRRLGFSKETVSGWMKRSGLVLKNHKKFKAGDGLTAVIYTAEKAP